MTFSDAKFDEAVSHAQEILAEFEDDVDNGVLFAAQDLANRERKQISDEQAISNAEGYLQHSNFRRGNTDYGAELRPLVKQFDTVVNDLYKSIY